MLLRVFVFIEFKKKHSGFSNCSVEERMSVFTEWSFLFSFNDRTRAVGSPVKEEINEIKNAIKHCNLPSTQTVNMHTVGHFEETDEALLA